VALLAGSTAQAGTCALQLDDPALRAVLASPIPTSSTWPDNFADVAESDILPLQGHWPKSLSVPPVEELEKFRHTHGLEVPRQIFYCQISGPITFPFRLRLFQTDGFVNALVKDPGGWWGEDLQNVTWDDPTIAAAGRVTGNPGDMQIVYATGHITLDPTKPRNWQPYTDAPPHGWYNEQFSMFTAYSEGTFLIEKFFLPFYSMRDPTQPETVPGDKYYPATNPWRGFTLFVQPGGGTPLGTEQAWGAGANAIGFLEGHQLPICSGCILVKPYTLTVFASSYGSGAFEPASFAADGAVIGGMVLDARVGENLHMMVQGTKLASKSVTQCCGSEFTFTFDPVQLGTGTKTITFNWNQCGGPIVNSTPDTSFPTRRCVSVLIGLPVTADPSLSPAPLPPPPPMPAAATITASVNRRPWDSPTR
jgi:hypothetical protein